MKRVLLGLLIIFSTISTANATWWIPPHIGPNGGFIGPHYQAGGWVYPHWNFAPNGLPYWEPGHHVGYSPFHPYCPRCLY